RFQERSDEGDIDLALSPDGKKLALAGQLSIRLLDLERGKEPARLADAARGLRRVLRFSRDGRTLGWSKDGGIALADVTALKETGSLNLANTNFAFLDDGKQLLSEQDIVTYLPEEGIRKPTPLSRHEFTYAVRDMATGKELRQLEPKPIIV